MAWVMCANGSAGDCMKHLERVERGQPRAEGRLHPRARDSLRHCRWPSQSAAAARPCLAFGLLLPRHAALTWCKAPVSAGGQASRWEESTEAGRQRIGQRHRLRRVGSHAGTEAAAAAAAAAHWEPNRRGSSSSGSSSSVAAAAASHLVPRVPEQRLLQALLVQRVACTRRGRGGASRAPHSGSTHTQGLPSGRCKAGAAAPRVAQGPPLPPPAGPCRRVHGAQQQRSGTAWRGGAHR